MCLLLRSWILSIDKFVNSYKLLRMRLSVFGGMVFLAFSPISFGSTIFNLALVGDFQDDFFYFQLMPVSGFDISTLSGSFVGFAAQDDLTKIPDGSAPQPPLSMYAATSFLIDSRVIESLTTWTINSPSSGVGGWGEGTSFTGFYDSNRGMVFNDPAPFTERASNVWSTSVIPEPTSYFLVSGIFYFWLLSARRYRRT